MFGQKLTESIDLSIAPHRRVTEVISATQDIPSELDPPSQRRSLSAPSEEVEVPASRLVLERSESLDVENAASASATASKAELAAARILSRVGHEPVGAPLIGLPQYSLAQFAEQKGSFSYTSAGTPF